MEITQRSSLIQSPKHLPKFIADQAARLAAAGIQSAAAEIEWMLCYVLEVNRLDLYLHGLKMLSTGRLQKIESIIIRRMYREPLQFILGEAWFYGRRFIVTPAVMAPTPETERLVERALGFIRTLEINGPRLLDIGIGSGVIGLTIACEDPTAKIVGLDISTDALAVANQNCELLGVADRVKLLNSDMFTALHDDNRFDLILANPPYIAEPDYASLDPEVHADPEIAMIAGPDGLDCIRAILRDAPRYLAANGRIMFEIGYGQSGKIAAMIEEDRRYRSMDIIKDFNDIDRVVILTCED